MRTRSQGEVGTQGEEQSNIEHAEMIKHHGNPSTDTSTYSILLPRPCCGNRTKTIPTLQQSQCQARVPREEDRPRLRCRLSREQAVPGRPHWLAWSTQAQQPLWLFAELRATQPLTEETGLWSWPQCRRSSTGAVAEEEGRLRLGQGFYGRGWRRGQGAAG